MHWNRIYYSWCCKIFFSWSLTCEIEGDSTLLYRISNTFFISVPVLKKIYTFIITILIISRQKPFNHGDCVGNEGESTESSNATTTSASNVKPLYLETHANSIQCAKSHVNFNRGNIHDLCCLFEWKFSDQLACIPLHDRGRLTTRSINPILTFYLIKVT